MTVVALTDATGVPVEAYRYDPYGKITYLFPSSSGAVDWSLPGSAATNTAGLLGNPFKFTGRRYDPETGFNYHRSRYMSPEMGRFVSSDTIGVWGDANALGNGFVYCSNFPTARSDPLGQGWFKSIAKAVMVAAVGVAAVAITAAVIASNAIPGINVAKVVIGAAVGATVAGALAAANAAEWTEVVSAAAGGAVTGALLSTGIGIAGGVAMGAAGWLGGNLLRQTGDMWRGTQCSFDFTSTVVETGAAAIAGPVVGATNAWSGRAAADGVSIAAVATVEATATIVDTGVAVGEEFSAFKSGDSHGCD